jgi:hypothetical protein
MEFIPFDDTESYLQFAAAAHLYLLLTLLAGLVVTYLAGKFGAIMFQKRLKTTTRRGCRAARTLKTAVNIGT